MRDLCTRWRFAILDAHPVCRVGLTCIVERFGLGTVVAEGASEHDLPRCLETRPDLLMLDLMLDGVPAFFAISEARRLSSTTRVVVISSLDEDLFAEACVREGASGYISKGEPTDRVAEAVERVLDGDVYLGDAVLRRVARRVAGGGAAVAPARCLTPREAEVFARLGAGMRANAIAVELGLSPKTVQTHLAKLQRKLGAANARELLRLAIGARVTGSD